MSKRNKNKQQTVLFCQTSNTKHIPFKPGMTVGNVLKEVGLGSVGQGQQLRVNGKPADQKQVLNAGDVVMIVGNTSGGQTS